MLITMLLTSHRLCDLKRKLESKTKKSKNDSAMVPRLTLSPTQLLFGLVAQRPLFPVRVRESAFVMEFDRWKTIQARGKLQSSDWEFLIVVYIIRDKSKLFGVSVVKKGADKTPLNLKMMQQVKCKPFISR